MLKLFNIFLIVLFTVLFNGFLGLNVVFAQDLDQKKEKNIETSQSKTDFENVVKSGEVLELQYVFNTNLNDIHLPPVFYLYIYTGADKHSFAVILQQGEHSLYFYPHLLGDITNITIEIPRIFVQTFGSVQATLHPKIKRYTLGNALKTWNNALPASVQDILYWQKQNISDTLYNDLAMGFGVSSTLIQQNQEQITRKITKGTNNNDEKKTSLPFTRDGTVFRWQSHQKTFVFIFDSRTKQSKYLKRLAFFVEKKGTRGDVLTNVQLTNRSGWGAHDYKPEDIADFFETARLKNIVLNDYEYELKRMLLHFGILVHNEKNTFDIKNVKVKSGEGYIASISRTTSYAVQNVLLTHEIIHAWFFESAQLRAVVHEVWKNTSDILKKSFKIFLASNSYDSNFQYLVENEFFAYLLQRTTSDLLWYAPAKLIRGSLSDLEIVEITNELIDAAHTLEEYIILHYSVQAGFLKYVIKF